MKKFYFLAVFLFAAAVCAQAAPREFTFGPMKMVAYDTFKNTVYYKVSTQEAQPSLWETVWVSKLETKDLTARAINSAAKDCEGSCEVFVCPNGAPIVRDFVESSGSVSFTYFEQKGIVKIFSKPLASESLFTQIGNLNKQFKDACEASPIFLFYAMF